MFGAISKCHVITKESGKSAMQLAYQVAYDLYSGKKHKKSGLAIQEAKAASDKHTLDLWKAIKARVAFTDPAEGIFSIYSNVIGKKKPDH